MHVLGIYTPGGAALMHRALIELRRSRHRLDISLGALATPAPALEQLTLIAGMTGGKLANLNRLAAARPTPEADWVLLIDDDVELGPGFLDRLVYLAEAFGLDCAQPALRRTSHTAWEVTRRRAALVRETPFVELGPVTLMTATVHRELSPFPERGMGWGVDQHWAAVARRRGWRLGVIDAVPIRHEARPTASAYAWQSAIADALELLSAREHLTYREADRTVARHTRLRR